MNLKNTSWLFYSIRSVPKAVGDTAPDEYLKMIQERARKNPNELGVMAYDVDSVGIALPCFITADRLGELFDDERAKAEVLQMANHVAKYADNTFGFPLDQIDFEFYGKLGPQTLRHPNESKDSWLSRIYTLMWSMRATKASEMSPTSFKVQPVKAKVETADPVAVHFSSGEIGRGVASTFNANTEGLIIDVMFTEQFCARIDGAIKGFALGDKISVPAECLEKMEYKSRDQIDMIAGG